MDEAPSRAARRDQQRRTRLLVGIGGGILAIAAIAVVVLLLAGGGDDDGKKTAAEDTTLAPTTSLSLQLGNVSTESAGQPAQLTPEQANAVLKVVTDYVDAASVDPLRSAEPAGDLSAIFDAGALARVAGADRAVMVDEGLPKVTGDLTVTAKPVDVVGLADQGGAIVLATASLDLEITGDAHVKAGPLKVARRGDLVLAPDAAGVWKITSFNVLVSRTGAGLDPTTTTAVAPTTARGSK
jgi:hypothetical protein